MFVTAEIGTSWKGDYQILEDMLRDFQIAKVDAIKFQSLSWDLMSRHTELDYYRYASLNENNIEQVADMCNYYDIEFYSTVTYPEAVEFLDKHVKRYKIRTLDSANQRLIDECLATGKEVLISSLRPLEYARAKIKNLYCIPRYPVPFDEINFDLMQFFDGYSNHCRNPLALFIPRNLDYLEFHVRPDNEFALDNSVSYSLYEMNKIMDILRKLN